MSSGLGDEDRAALRFIAAHPVVLADQLAQLLDLDGARVASRMSALYAQGLVQPAPRLRHLSDAWRIAALGLRALEDAGAPAPIDLRAWWRDLGVGYLHVSAAQGAFGTEVERVLTRRDMVVADATLPLTDHGLADGLSPKVRAKLEDRMFGSALDVDGGDGGGEVHYPDLMFISPAGRIAVELLLAAPPQAQLLREMNAYARKSTIAAVLVFVEDGRLGPMLETVAERSGLGKRLIFQRVAFADGLR